jgi:Flp pilus assembly protein TadG
MRRRSDSGGTISLELAVLAIPLLMLMMLMWAFGVYAQAESLSDQAARDAVRAATQSRSADEAEEKIAAAVESTTADAEYVGRYMDCSYEPDLPQPFTAQPTISQAEMVTVTVTVTCRIDLSAAAFLPLRSATVVSTFVSPLDSYRGYYP